MFDMTSEGARRAWGDFLDRAESGHMVTVTKRGRPMLVAMPWKYYNDQVGATLGTPVRVAQPTSGTELPAWWDEQLIEIESSVAKDSWRLVQVWVEDGGHAIIERYGRRPAVLTPVSWLQEDGSTG